MYDNLCSWNNLLLAYRKASKGKRGQNNVAAFEYKLEDNLLQLQSELKQKIYQPGAYHSFYVHDPKKRLISAAPFRDRVVHHALCNVIEPIFERSFIHDFMPTGSAKAPIRRLTVPRNLRATTAMCCLAIFGNSSQVLTMNFYTVYWERKSIILKPYGWSNKL